MFAALVFAAALVCKMAPAMAETEPQTGVSFPMEIVGEKGPLKYVLRPVFLDGKRSASSTGSDPAEHAQQYEWAPRGLSNSPLSRDLLGSTSPVCSHAASVRCDGTEAERNSQGPPAVVGRLAGTAVRVKKIAFIPIQVATPCPRIQCSRLRVCHFRAALRWAAATGWPDQGFVRGVSEAAVRRSTLWVCTLSRWRRLQPRWVPPPRAQPPLSDGHSCPLQAASPVVSPLSLLGAPSAMQRARGGQQGGRVLTRRRAAAPASRWTPGTQRATRCSRRCCPPRRTSRWRCAS